MRAPPLSLALDRYDRHFPFFDGTVSAPKGVALTVLQVGQSQDWRDGGPGRGHALRLMDAMIVDLV